MRNLIALSLIAALSGCAASTAERPATKAGVAALDVRRTPASTKALDEIAAAYLRLTLEIGTHEPGYIDAYYGPPELQKAAEAAPRDKPALLAETRDLMAQIDLTARRLPGPLDRRRAAFLRAQLRAAETRLLMMQGTRFAFADEAERLFGVRPRLHPAAGARRRTRQDRRAGPRRRAARGAGRGLSRQVHHPHRSAAKDLRRRDRTLPGAERGAYSDARGREFPAGVRHRQELERL